MPMNLDPVDADMLQSDRKRNAEAGLRERAGARRREDRWRRERSR